MPRTIPKPRDVSPHRFPCNVPHAEDLGLTGPFVQNSWNNYDAIDSAMKNGSGNLFITGDAGIGKTRAVWEWISRRRWGYGFTVWWIDASTWESSMQGLVDLSRELFTWVVNEEHLDFHSPMGWQAIGSQGQQGIVDHILDLLHDTTSGWLIVFDGAPKGGDALRFMPIGQHSRSHYVICTTRDPQYRTKQGHLWINSEDANMDPLPMVKGLVRGPYNSPSILFGEEEESMVLQQRAGDWLHFGDNYQLPRMPHDDPERPMPTWLDDDKPLKRIVQGDAVGPAPGRLYLALQLAMKIHDNNISKFVKKFMKSRRKLEDKLEKQGIEPSDRSRYILVDVGIEALSPAALTLAQFLAFCGGFRVPWSICLFALEPEFDAAALRAARAELETFGMAAVHITYGSVQLFPTWTEPFRLLVLPDIPKEKTHGRGLRAIRALASLWAEITPAHLDASNSIPYLRASRPLLAVSVWLGKDVYVEGKEPGLEFKLPLAVMSFGVAMAISNVLCQHKEAATWFDLAKKRAEAHYESKTSEGLFAYLFHEALNALKTGFVDLIKPLKAEHYTRDWYEKGIALMNKAINLPRDEEINMTDAVIAWAYLEARELDICKTMCEALRLSQDLIGQPLAWKKVLNTLAYAQSDSGDTQAAEETAREILRYCEEQFGPTAPETVDQLVTLGHVQLARKHWSNALSTLERAQQLRAQYYGERDFRVGWVMFSRVLAHAAHPPKGSNAVVTSPGGKSGTSEAKELAEEAILTLRVLGREARGMALAKDVNRKRVEAERYGAGLCHEETPEFYIASGLYREDTYKYALRDAMIDDKWSESVRDIAFKRMPRIPTFRDLELEHKKKRAAAGVESPRSEKKAAEELRRRQMEILEEMKSLPEKIKEMRKVPSEAELEKEEQLKEQARALTKKKAEIKMKLFNALATSALEEPGDKDPDAEISALNKAIAMGNSAELEWDHRMVLLQQRLALLLSQKLDPDAEEEWYTAWAMALESARESRVAISLFHLRSLASHYIRLEDWSQLAGVQTQLACLVWEVLGSDHPAFAEALEVLVVLQRKAKVDWRVTHTTVLRVSMLTGHEEELRSRLSELFKIAGMAAVGAEKDKNVDKEKGEKAVA